MRDRRKAYPPDGHLAVGTMFAMPQLTNRIIDAAIVEGAKTRNSTAQIQKAATDINEYLC
jgi:hypothetical protein